MAGVAATLNTESGPVFAKGIKRDDSRAWMLRTEIRFAPWLPATAPTLRWAVETGGWLLAGFDHAPGSHADLSPGSPDLATVAGALADLSAELTPTPISARPFATRWRGLIDPGIVDGTTLLHTDPTPRNFLVADGRVRVVDWSAPAAGAAWLDTALMVPRLIRAGHTPGNAEVWARNVPAYRDAPDRAVTVFAAVLAGLWADRARRLPCEHRRPLAAAAALWASCRAGRVAEM